jgi:hypothetical protein
MTIADHCGVLAWHALVKINPGHIFHNWILQHCNLPRWNWKHWFILSSTSMGLGVHEH